MTTSKRASEALEEGDGSLSRRGFLKVSLASAVAAAGPYGLIERLAPPEKRLRRPLRALGSPTTLPIEQYLFDDVRVVKDNGVAVDAPPLCHEIVTANLNVASTATALQSAQREIETVLGRLEAAGLLTFTPAGLGLALAWGLPYFRRLPASLVSKWMPLDKSAPTVRGSYQSVLLPSVRFASDPATAILEGNELAVVMASDSLPHLATAYSEMFEGSLKGLFKITSRRKGFVDATKLGSSGQSLTKQFALAHSLPGAASIPDQAELFLGFTSTQSAGLGQSGIANFESLGMTDQGPRSYFAGGTILALSHLYENVARWYTSHYSDRLQIAFRPSLAGVKAGTLTVPQGPSDIESEADVLNDIGSYGMAGHAGSLQPVSRLQESVNGYAAGSAIPVRADFNTVDNPFFYTSNPVRDQWSPTPAAGVHFLSYVPTSHYFQRLRAAMDGGLNAADGASASYEAFVNTAGIETSHRQNFLVPPRAHRALPLAEHL
jgi:hypothetical protein